MNNTYDIAIVGCGIPGLYAARELSSEGLKVVIFDRSKEKGEPNYSTAGVPYYVIEKYSLPYKVIASDIRSIGYSSGKYSTKKTSDKVISYVLDFKRTKSLLADEVEALNGKVLWGCNIDEIKKHNDEYILRSSSTVYRSRYVIDASGISSSLGEDMGLEEKISEPLSTGFEYIVKSKSEKMVKYKHNVGLFLNRHITPYGYGWVFDNGKDTYKIGICEFYIDKKRGLPPLDERLNRFLGYIMGNEKYEIKEKHGGSKLITHKYKTYYKDRMLGIGDSIGAINPFWGEGIRQGLDSAQFAVGSILDDIKNNSGLGSYKKKMDEYHDFKWKCSEILSKLIYKKRDQVVFDEMVKYMDKYMTVDDVLAMGFDYDINRMAMRSPIKFTLLALKLIL